MPYQLSQPYFVQLIKKFYFTNFVASCASLFWIRISSQSPRCSVLGCQLVALWEADGIFGRWDLTEGTWVSGNISWRRCWKASLFLCFFAWWTLGTSLSATLSTVMSCLNVSSNAVKRWPQTKPSKLWVKREPFLFTHLIPSDFSSQCWKTLQKLSLYGLYFLFEYSWAVPKLNLKVTLLLYSSSVSWVLASFPT